MSRWKQLEDIEERLPDLSADEIRAAVEMWRKHLQRLRGPALKSGHKFLRRLDRALEHRSVEDEASKDSDRPV